VTVDNSQLLSRNFETALTVYVMCQIDGSEDLPTCKRAAVSRLVSSETQTEHSTCEAGVQTTPVVIADVCEEPECSQSVSAAT